MDRLLHRIGPLIGRLLLAAIFILAGIEKIRHFPDTLAHMSGKGLPAANVLLVLTIAIELGGGVMIALGVWARWAAVAIFLFLIPVTGIFHDFWNAAGPEAAQQLRSFMKNLAIMGGMAYIAAYGSGPFSLLRRSDAGD
jgi:putative oxidoreductase